MRGSTLARIWPLALLLACGGFLPALAEPVAIEVETAELLRLRERPSTEARRLGLLLQGERVGLVGRQGLWFRVRTRYGVGWVHGDYVRSTDGVGAPWLSQQPPALPAVARVGEGASLRSRPSVDSPRRTIVPAGSLLLADRVEDDWIHVTSSAGTGWVHAGAIVVPATTASAVPRADREAVAALPEPVPERTREVPFRVVPDDRAEAPSLPFVRGYRRPLLATWLPTADRLVIARALEGEDGVMWLPLERLVELGLDAERLTPVEIEGHVYVALDGVSGLSYTLDRSTQQLRLDLDPALFETTRLDIHPSRYMPPSKSEPGVLLNYDVLGTRTDTPVGVESSVSGQLDLRAFGRFGSVSHLMTAVDGGGERRLSRLLTTWRVDRPETMRTWLVGDSTTPSGPWWRAAQLAGVQWSSNFATRPGFLPYPQPTLSGEAVWPSEIEIYLGEVLRERRAVPAGPFEIHNVPVVSGRGDFTYVIRDALGREVVTSNSFYAEPTLLKRGLSDFSFTLGALRERLGEASAQYGEAVGVASYRRGLARRVTFESHAEVQAERGTVGAGVSALLPRFGTVQLGIASSRDDGESGTLLSYGYSFNDYRFNLAVTGEAADRSYWRLGETSGSRTRDAVRARVGASIPRIGTMSVVYVSRRRERDDEVETLGLHLNARLSDRLVLQVSGLESRSVGRERYVTFLLSRVLGRTRTASLSSTVHDGSVYRSGVRLQQAVPFDSGVGFALAAEGGEDERLQGSVGIRTPRGDFQVEASAAGDSLALRPSWSGSVVAVGGGLYTSRRIGDSFGLAQTGGVPNVRIYHENRLVGRTDRDGRLLVPSLLPYQPNKLRAELEDLPIRARTGELELEVSPYSDSGVAVDFPIDLSASALVELVLADATLVPTRAVVVDLETDEVFPVALGGQVYLTGIRDSARYRVFWGSRTCDFELHSAVGVEPLSRVACREPSE